MSDEDPSDSKADAIVTRDAPETAPPQDTNEPADSAVDSSDDSAAQDPSEPAVESQEPKPSRESPFDDKLLTISDEGNAQENSWRFSRIPSEVMTGLEGVFRPPPAIAEFERKQRRNDKHFRPDKRILVVVGPPNSGRYSCALWLGLQALKALGERDGFGECFEYQPELSWIEELTKTLSGASGSRRVYLVRDAVPSGRQRPLYSEEQFLALAERCAEKGSFLLLTCSPDLDPRYRLFSSLEFIDLQGEESPEFMAAVVRNYVSYGFDLDDELKNAVLRVESSPEESDRLSGRLKSPPLVANFFYRLQRRGAQCGENESLESALRRLAEETAVVRRLEVREWFAGLSLNRKLYVLLVGSFPKIDRYRLDELNAKLVRALRVEGVELYDFREESVEELFEVLHLQCSDGTTLEFDNARYEQEVQRQLVNYHQLLWSVTPTVMGWIKDLGEDKLRPIRQILGRGIGRMGVHQWPNLERELQELADHDRGYAAVVPGYALQAIIELSAAERDLNRLGYVVQLLRSWAEPITDSERIGPEKPRRIWSAAAAVWRCFGRLAGIARETGPSASLPAIARDPSRSDRNGETWSVSLSAAEAVAETERILEDLAVAIALLPGRVHAPKPDPEFDRCCSGLIFACRRIFDDEPERLVQLLCRWMNGGKTPSEDAHELPEEADAEKREVAAPPQVAETSPNAESATPASKPEKGEPPPKEDAAALAEKTPSRKDGSEADQAESEADETKKMHDQWREIVRPGTLVYFGVNIAATLLDAYRDSRWMEERKQGLLLRLIRPILSLTAEDVEEANIARDVENKYGAIQALVDMLMSVVQGWLTNEQWEQRVYCELLRALNRSRLGVRRRFCRSLTSDWLTHDDPRIRRIGEALLARAQIIDGMAVDMPGAGGGMLCVDGSPAARYNNSGSTAGFHLYERLRALTDLTVTVLGSRRPLVLPGKNIERKEFRLQHSHARLLVPLLEQQSAARVHYVLVLYFGLFFDSQGLVCDWLDALEDPLADWKGKLLWRTTAPAGLDPEQISDPEVLAGLGQIERSVVRLEQNVQRYNLERQGNRIQEEVNSLLAKSLSLRTDDQWQAVMRPHLPADVEVTPNGIRQYLDGLSQRLDQLPDEEQCDLARKIGCGVLWLATWDMSAAVELLEKWIAAPNEAPQPPLGWSYTLMILNVLLNRPIPRGEVPAAQPAAPERFTGFRRRSAEETGAPVPPPAPAIATASVPRWEDFAPLLRLAPRLAKSSSLHCVGRVLEWVRHWIHLENWSKKLATSRELLEMIDGSPPEWRGWYLDRLEAWKTPRKDQGETVAPVHAIRLADVLCRRVLTGPRKVLPELPTEAGLFVVILDPFAPNSVKRRRYAKLAHAIIKYYGKTHRSRYAALRVAVYRLGESSPAVAPGEFPAAEDIVPDQLPAAAPLAAPILESLRKEAVRGVLLLTERPPADAEDCLESWRSQGRIYAQQSKALTGSIWNRIDPVSGGGDSTKKAVEEITRAFVPLLKGADDDAA